MEAEVDVGDDRLRRAVVVVAEIVGFGGGRVDDLNSGNRYRQGRVGAPDARQTVQAFREPEGLGIAMEENIVPFLQVKRVSM